MTAAPRAHDDGVGVPDSRDAADPVERLHRWEQFGATWQPVALTPTEATVSLCRCDGGEEVERFTSSDPALLALVRAVVGDRS